MFRLRPTAFRCENGLSKLLSWDQMGQSFLLRSSTESYIDYILHLTNPHEVLPHIKDHWLTKKAFKKPPFKLEEQGWGEFDMSITLSFAEKSGTKDLTHDLHFQAPKYETTHVVVLTLSLAPEIDLLV